MSTQINDKLNGFGIWLRFITPILLTILLFILNGLKDEIKDVRNMAKELAKETAIYHTNHLSHHTKMEISFCERLVALETELKRLRN
jgi:hypothetical protein